MSAQEFELVEKTKLRVETISEINKEMESLWLKYTSLDGVDPRRQTRAEKKAATDNMIRMFKIALTKGVAR